MRFFKTLSLLHRRTKSDSALAPCPPGPENSIFLCISPQADPRRGCQCDAAIESGPPIRSSASLNLRLFEIDLENRWLNRINASLISRLTLMETQLQLTKSELYAEVHRGVHLRRQVRRDKDTIAELQKKSDQLARSLIAASMTGLSPGKFEPPCTESRSGNTTLQSTDRSLSLGRLPARQTDDQQQYSTALQLILKTRQELRGCKKIALFWKRKAKTIPEFADLVTPSPSEISEVQATLPRERAEAVNELRKKRQLTMTSLNGIYNTHTSPTENLVPSLPPIADPGGSKPEDWLQVNGGAILEKSHDGVDKALETPL